MDPISEIENMKAEVKVLREHQAKYSGKYHDMDKELVQIRSDLAHLREDVSNIKGGVNKLIWTVGGAVTVAVVAFALRGGLVL